MKRWNRWQDYVAIAAGAYAALATMWTSQTAGATTMMIGAGVLLVVSGVWNLMRPGTPVGEWVQMVLGALLFISPWVAGYSGYMGAAWTSWIAGAVALIAGVLAVQPSMREHTVGHDKGLPAH